MAYTTIDNPALFFNTKLYTGNGTAIASGGQNITGVGFQPDWVWIKDRSDSDRPRLFDAVRGVTKAIDSSDNTTESTLSEGLTAFGSDGFTVGNHAGVNSSSDNFVAWNWLGANGTTSNSDGSITSTVSVNSTSGFSITKWSGTDAIATIGHGLGTTPKVVIVKNLGGANAWNVYHSSIPNMDTGYIELNTVDRFYTNSDRWSQQPTSTVFGVNANANVNSSGNDYIAYCFAEVKGYSKFGSFTGNEVTDGPFAYTGFKPAFIIIKRSSGGTGSWAMFDNKRNTFNVVDNRLYANAADAEGTSAVDFLSNGFKIKTADGNINSSASTHIFMAFAEAPFVTSGTKAAGTAR
tara:strand:+ start:1821 stop:2870 length:1050 start_codon:yes stop_codon:yes gene_type:complete